MTSGKAKTGAWQTISRVLGLVIIVVELAVYTVAAFDRTVQPADQVMLPMLVIAAALIGVPSGYRLLVSRNGSTGSG